ncbi:MAG TPA: BON domain-containing protein [Verrucomicrobiae bacterium]|nr:BON domain-containing protein [Verrucomicrobiae bacterium]
MRFTCLLGLAGSVFLAAGCATTGPTQGQARAAADRSLENNIRNELSRYGELGEDAPNIQIVARDGSVTLAGPVRNEKHREMIDTLVRNTGGVAAVNDQLLVTYPPTGVEAPSPYAPASVYTTIPPGATPPPVVVPGPAAIPGEYPNSRIRPLASTDKPLVHRIVDQLRDDTIPPEWLQSVTVSVTDGNVYMQGYVDNEQEHRTIVAAIQRCRGVVAIYDQTQLR